LLNKLLKIVRNSATTSSINTGQRDNSKLDHVWVLAALLGGPEAVKSFIQALPKDLSLAMVYGQHIEENFDQWLIRDQVKLLRLPDWY
jgi:chemosensory pili system protein ChpB (putative protein-glutamate methylesterase)